MKTHACDVVVVGSGAGGAVAAHRLAEMGLKVVLVEAGSYFRTQDYTTDFWETMKNLFWDHGFQYAPGKPTIPFLQGRAVGGTTVINSAISWDLPRAVFEDWVLDEAFELDYSDIAVEQERLRSDLNIREVEATIQGENNNVMARAAERLGWAGKAVQRNERNCQGSGRCLVGCPNGAKLSMEQTYVPWALEKGLNLISDCEAERVIVDKGQVRGLIARHRKLDGKSAEKIRINAKRIVIAAGVIQSPQILQRSYIPDPHHLIGSHLMAHPGVSIIGLFDEVINVWNGATQGYEVTEFMDQRLKLESLGVSPSLFGVRLPGAGKRLAELYEQRGHMTLWASPIRAESVGSVRRGRLLSPIRYGFHQVDLNRFLKGIRYTGELLFAGGAREVYPGIVGRSDVVRSVEELHEVTRDPVRGVQIHPVATHLFGTCRLSADPKRGVIDQNFESHHIKGLYVADGSVFPSNTGVNPQLAIMALAGVAAKRVAASL